MFCPALLAPVQARPRHKVSLQTSRYTLSDLTNSFFYGGLDPRPKRGQATGLVGAAKAYAPTAV